MSPWLVLALIPAWWPKLPSLKTPLGLASCSQRPGSGRLSLQGTKLHSHIYIYPINKAFIQRNNLLFTLIKWCLEYISALLCGLRGILLECLTLIIV